MNYILYEDGSKEQIINYSIIDGHLCGIWSSSGDYYTFHEVITKHPESGLCVKLPVFEKRIIVEDYLYGGRTEYIKVNNIKEVVIEFPSREVK